MEEWKDIKGFEGYYQVSTFGNVRSVDRYIIRNMPEGPMPCLQKGTRIHQQINKGTRKGVKPRYELGLSKKGRVTRHQVHRLVAFTFFDVEIESRLEVNHKDGNPLNNRLDNLEIVTRLDNVRHAFENGLIGTSYKVIRTNPDTGEEQEFYSVSCAARTIPISQGSLKFHLDKRDEQLLYKGYRWRYKQEPVETIESTRKRKRVE